MVECIETKPDEGEVEKRSRFKWITDLKIKANKVVELASLAGRNRWKIENEGFNIQKRGGYQLEHGYSKNETAMKVFYYLLQIAHLIFQLIEKGSLLKNLLSKKKVEGFASAKDIAARILEAWRNCVIGERVLERIRSKRIQIRFDTS